MQTFRSDEHIDFAAMAYDRDDGNLPGSAFSWNSDIDGNLGDGMPLSVPGLSPGLHRIRVEVDDALKESASDEIRILIYEPYDSDQDGIPDAIEEKYGTLPDDPDSDGDGLHDGWERQYKLNPRDPGDVAQDRDGDGKGELQEFLDGTDPLNISSAAGVDAPDILPVAWEVPAMMEAGQTIAVGWVVSNQGAVAAVASWTDRVCLSDDSDFETVNTILFSAEHKQDLLPGGGYSSQANILIPDGLTGPHTLFFKTDAVGDSVAESNQHNNVTAWPVTFAVPTLEPVQLRAAPRAHLGSRLAVDWAVQNLGGSTVQSNMTALLMLSTSVHMTADAELLLQEVVGTDLAPGETFGRLESVALPDAPFSKGDYHLLLALMDGEGSVHYPDIHRGSQLDIPLHLDAPPEVPPDELIFLDLSGNEGDEDNSAILPWNRHPTAAATVRLHATGPVAGGATDNRFVLGPYGMDVEVSGVGVGDLLMLVMLEYTSDAIVPGDVRSLLMRVSENGRWAWQSAGLLEAEDLAAPLALLRARNPSVLGRQGNDLVRGYVWSAVDTPGAFSVGRQNPALSLDRSSADACSLRFDSAARRPYELQSVESLGDAWAPYLFMASGASASNTWTLGTGESLELSIESEDAQRYFRLNDPRPEP